MYLIICSVLELGGCLVTSLNFFTVSSLGNIST